MYTKEFFEQHKEKLYKSLDEFFVMKGLTRERLVILREIYLALNLYNGLIQDEIYKNVTEQDIQKVETFGQNNEYPELILNKVDGKITKYITRGEDHWKEALSWSKLNSPYKDNFIDLLKAINEYETLCK